MTFKLTTDSAIQTKMTQSDIPAELHLAVIQCLNTYLEKAQRHFQTQFAVPNINYRQRGAIAGSAHLTRWEIRLNKVLLLENQHAFIETVIPHELAHLCVFKQFGRVAPHGKEWQWLMQTVFEQAPHRTHQFAVNSVQNRPFIYQCGCQMHTLSPIRHNKIVKKKQTYVCRQCQKTLVFVEETVVKK